MDDATRGAWAKRLRLHDSVDVLGIVPAFPVWCEAVVIALTPRDVQIHFRGWVIKYDEWLPLLSPRLAPAYTHVKNWRAALAVGHRVQTARRNESDAERSRVWCGAVVRQVCTTAEGTKLVLVEIDGDKGSVWIDVMSETLCAPGTHRVSPLAIVAPVKQPDARDAVAAKPTSKLMRTKTIGPLVRPHATRATPANATSTDALRELFDEWHRHDVRLDLFGTTRSKFWAGMLEAVRVRTMEDVWADPSESPSRCTLLHCATLAVKNSVDAIAKTEADPLLLFRARSVQVALQTIVQLYRT